MTEQEIFIEAMDRADRADQQRFLDEACAGDAALRERVEKLIYQADQLGSFLEHPPVQVVVEDGFGSAGGGDLDATILHGAGSTKDNGDATALERTMKHDAQEQEGEIPLGYLQPSTKPNSLGRLGHYEVLEVVGRGAFGTVLRAFDEKLQRVVAIKVLAPEMAATSPARKRFLREARTSAAIRHENVVAIHAVEDEPIPYLVMEYIPGQTLQQRLDKTGPLPVIDVLKLGKQIAEGLAAAHAQNLIHRDIKPGNILLEGGVKERVKITDFGLARTTDDASMTQSGMIAGTPLYMAPEQARGETLDHRTDLFSLGSVLYQMVSGRPPFRAANTVAVLKRVCDDNPRAIQEIIPETPSWLTSIIFRLLEKDRDQRFQTAQEVATVLGRCQSEWEATGHVVSIPCDAPTQLFTNKHTTSASSENANVGRQRGVMLGMVMTLLAVLFVLVASPRIARWFDASIPSLPATESTAGLRFDGKDDFVVVDGLTWDYPQFTIECYVTSAVGSDNGTIAVLSGGAGSEAEWMLLFDGSPAEPGKRISGAGIKGAAEYASAYGPFRGGERQHRALVYDGKCVNYYINGVWQGKRFAQPFEGMQWKMRALHIGSGADGRRFFQGTIDQLRVSRVARYSDSFEPEPQLDTDKQTLALYRFDEGSDDVLKDDSGNGHDGKIVGAKWLRANGKQKVAEPSDVESRAAIADAPKPAIAPFDAAQAKAYQEAWAKHLGVPVEYENSIGMKFRLIPPGEFLMGSTPEEIEVALKATNGEKHWQDCIKSEGPQHKVILTQPIYLGMKEVTQSEYEKVMGENPSHFAPAGMGKEVVAGLETDKHPVEMVSWSDAAEFCAKLSQQEKFNPFYSLVGDAVTQLGGTGYRLPSEAEWEYACRAGTATRYWSGDQVEDLVRAGWFGKDLAGDRTHAAGELQVNPFGLADIHGNVWEWVQDGWDATYYGQFLEKPAINPNSPFSPGSERVMRGGNWAHTASDCRSSGRDARDPTFRVYTVGFRVSLSVDAVKAALAARTPAVTNTKRDAPSPAIAPFDAAQAKAYQEAWAKHLGVPVEYTNSIGMKFRLIPPGEFLMGSSAEEIEVALKDAPLEQTQWREVIKSEAPQHKVVLTQPIYLGVTEVTQGEYQKVMSTNPSDFSSTGGFKDLVAGTDTSNQPVEMVVWNEAVEFCSKLSLQEKFKPFYVQSENNVTALEGTGYRLPLEAEWEFACRAGTSTKYVTGDDEAALSSVCWPQGGPPHAVGLLKANPFGLYDMHGNVWEWMQDGWDANWYGRFQEKPAINPNNPFTADSLLVLRGGSCNAGASRCRSSHRSAGAALGRDGSIGFRVALPVDAIKQRLNAQAAATGSAKNAVSEPTAKRRFVSDEWIDVIPIVDPQLDKWDLPQRTGKNVWQIDGTELVSDGGQLASKFIWPLDSDWSAFECEIEFTRRSGAKGFIVNLPTKVGECPLVFDAPGVDGGAWLGSRAKGMVLKSGPQITTGERATLRVEVRRPQESDQVSVILNGTEIGKWSGDRSAISNTSREGFPHDRRISLWIHPGGNEFVFHRIRVRTLDGGTAESLRPVSKTVPTTSPPPATAPFDAAAAKAHQEAWAKHLGVPVEYTNSIGMKFRLIPPGAFAMGSTPKEIDAAIAEFGHDGSWLQALRSQAPRHEVTLTKPFYLAVHEVTQGAYESVMGYNPAHFSASRPGKDAVAGVDTTLFPVEMITWTDAVNFCSQLNQRDGLSNADVQIGTAVQMREGMGYRLPTEAEWEFACRAGTVGRYSSGDAETDLTNVGWWRSNSGMRTHTVGVLPGNPFGLFDMHGNVYEWVLDGWHPSAYSNFERVPAIDPATPFETTLQRIARGGDWNGTASHSRSSNRLFDTSSAKYYSFGFRIALSVEAMKAARPTMQVAKKLGPTVKQTLSDHPDRVNLLVYSPDGRFLASAGDKAVKLWAADTGRLHHSLSVPNTGSYSALAFSPDSRWLVTASNARNEPAQLIIFNVETGAEVGQLAGHTDGIFEVAFSLDGKRLVSGGWDKTICYWDFEKRTLHQSVPVPNQSWIRSIQVSSTGMVAVGSEKVFLYKPDGSLTFTLNRFAGPLTFSPDGRRLAGTNWNEGMVYLWDSETGREIAAWQAHKDKANCVSFSRDGSVLASAGWDHKVRLWLVDSQRQIAEMPHEGAFGVAFSLDGQTLASSGADHEIKLWDISAFLREHQAEHARTTTFTNSLGMEFVKVPKGKAWLGGGKDKLGDKEVEIPADFYLGKYEVTQDEWTQVMGENPSYFSRTGEGKDTVTEISDADLQRFPVEMVSWDDCQLFIAKLNERENETGWAYRLPTATEWEYACRGGPMTDKANSAFDFYFAKPTNNPLREQVSFGKNMGLNRTGKVGSHEANGLGVFDMHRNVWEWCDDSKEAANGNIQRVQMGGAWNHIRWRSAASNLESEFPSHRSNALGLRLACVPSGGTP